MPHSRGFSVSIFQATHTVPIFIPTQQWWSFSYWSAVTYFALSCLCNSQDRNIQMDGTKQEMHFNKGNQTEFGCMPEINLMGETKHYYTVIPIKGSGRGAGQDNSSFRRKTITFNHFLYRFSQPFFRSGSWKIMTYRFSNQCCSWNVWKRLTLCSEKQPLQISGQNTVQRDHLICTLNVCQQGLRSKYILLQTLRSSSLDMKSIGMA